MWPHHCDKYGEDFFHSEEKHESLNYPKKNAAFRPLHGQYYFEAVQNKKMTECYYQTRKPNTNQIKVGWLLDWTRSDSGWEDAVPEADLPTLQSIQQTLPLESEIEKFIPKI